MGRLKYKEIAKESLSEKRNIVISETFDENEYQLGFSVSEQLVVREAERETRMFMKNGLGILSKEGLKNLRTAVNKACEIAGID